MEKGNIIEGLEGALLKRDPDFAEDAIRAAHEFGIEKEFVPYLVQLLLSEWHFRHEDIALALQWSKDDRATKALLLTAQKKFDYLAYDNSNALARKCTWALADIGTSESQNALIEILNYPDETISGYARKRLDNWEAEQGRKGQSE